MKITKYIMMLAAAVGMAAACQQEEFVVFHPEDVIAPVLHEVEDVVITEDNLKTGSLEFTWDAADFGFKTEVLYSVTATGANGKTVNFISDVKGTSYKVTYEKINGHLLYDFEIPSGEAGEVTYTISAKLRKSDSFTGNQQSNNMTPIFSEKVYAKMWVVGSYNGWAHDSSNQFLYNYAEDGVIYTGVIDFGENVRGKRCVKVVDAITGLVEEHLIPMGKQIVVFKGDRVKKGQQLTEGPVIPQEILEVQQVYRLQGVEINDKHIEIIVRQMLRKVRITNPGDTDFLWGEQVTRQTFLKVNEEPVIAG